MLINCPKCNAQFKLNKFKRHFRKVHPELPSEVVDELERKSRKTFQTPDYTTILSREKQKINHMCFIVEREFETFSNSKYFEFAEFKFNRLWNIIDAYVKGNKNDRQLPEAIRSKVKSFEQSKISELKTRLIEFKESTPDKVTFIKSQCQTVYLTWDDITFERNKIRVSVNKAFVQPMEMPGSIRIYNEIKIDYFKRKFPKAIYKLVVYKGIVLEDLSQGPSQIRNLIAEHAADLESSKKTEKVHKELTEGEFTSNELLEVLERLAIKNQYLSTAAKLLRKSDNVTGILENNKGNEEEALLFNFHRADKMLVLWENINPNRAAYLFVFEEDDFSNLERLKTIIKANIDYKRYNLFIGTNTEDTFNLTTIEYYQLNHFDQFEYGRKLRLILNKY
jgi:uncharacterized C2H2 Zn-finger protein